MPPIFRKLVLAFARPRTEFPLQNTFHRMKNRPAENFHLETGVMGSVFGDGRFLKTEDFPNQSWSRTEAIIEIKDRSWDSEISNRPSNQ